MDDNSIIRLYNERDERAITETSDKYGDYCYRIAYNILSDTSDSEECLNDTWMKTWNSIPPAVPKCLRHFLSKIVRNLSLDRYKYSKRAKRGSGELAVALEEIDEFVSGTIDVESEVLKGELSDSINAFLCSLPARECDVFLRRYYYVDSVPDIADRYAMTESNVYMLLSRTRKKLREHLREEGYVL